MEKQSKKLSFRKERDAPAAGKKLTGKKKPKAQLNFVAEETAAAPVRRKVAEESDDNAGLDAASYTPEAARAAGGAGKTAGKAALSTAKYSKKLVQDMNGKSTADGLHEASVFDEFLENHPEISGSTAKSRAAQRMKLKQDYAKAKRTADNAAKSGKIAGFGIGTIREKLLNFKDNLLEYTAGHPGVVLTAALIALVLFFVITIMSSCSILGTAVGNVSWATSYTAEDPDINGSEYDYDQLEKQLRRQIDNIESDYPDYDEYNYYLDEINHNPYELASYLTVKFDNYTREQVQITLKDLFDKQYELRLEEVVETREDEDGDSYDYYILNVYLTNKGLGTVIQQSGMDESESKRYTLLNQTYGNRRDLFTSDVYAQASDDYLDYDVPGEALTDQRFANMINEAEKYLGYPYVWGGSSPSTSFDCSGFVSYVINHCGNGWNVGRLTANGLKNICSIIPASEAKPGDLIFFKGTYNTTGASHVGIYVGNGMMIHCGNPIQYASVETSYWQQHFYCYGRLN